MTSAPPTTPTIPVAANTPQAAERPRPTRTAYRPAADTSFSEALKAARSEAVASQTQAAPSSARIAAPAGAQPVVVASPNDLLMAAPEAAAPVPTPYGTVDLRLWESLMRGAPAQAPAQPAATAQARPAVRAAAPVTALANRAQPVAPTSQAVTPAALREQGQAFLRSIEGFDQTRVDEYENVAQARAWGYSTCSAASLTAVLRAAGQDVKIADVMKEMPGGMTIKLGLVSRPSLVNAATKFGARATDEAMSYETLKAATDSGQPVLVDIRNSRFPEGHWIVVTGVDENGVQCADSSRYDLTSISRGELMRSWSGRGIRIEGLTPTAAPVRRDARSA